ncbi:MAG: PLDc N-terminal domain-containing protein [Chloroflexota bacterium]|nr:PLDc N-terminal domain-containing protein [Chloroflexota bacterium]
MVLQGLNLLILVGWITLVIVALLRLRRCQLDQIARVLWVLVLLVPFIGALAFFIVGPDKSQSGEVG